jgi:hypothetical protein
MRTSRPPTRPIDVVERQERRQRRPGARRLQVLGWTVRDPLIEREEAVEATDRGDGAPDRARREAAAHLCADERLERVAIELFDRRAGVGGERRQLLQIAAVALDGVIGQPALDAQVVEIGLNHGWL